MKEIIDRILNEEESARTKIEGSHSQAQALILKTKEEAESLIKEAVDSANGLARGKTEESEKAFLAEKENIIKETKAAVESVREARNKDIPKIVNEIFLKIIS